MNREDTYRICLEAVAPAENAAMHRAMQSRGVNAEKNAALIMQHMKGKDFTTAEAEAATDIDREQLRRSLLRMKRKGLAREVGERKSEQDRREKIWRIV